MTIHATMPWLYNQPYRVTHHIGDWIVAWFHKCEILLAAFKFRSVGPAMYVGVWPLPLLTFCSFHSINHQSKQWRNSNLPIPCLIRLSSFQEAGALLQTTNIIWPGQCSSPAHKLFKRIPSCLARFVRHWTLESFLSEYLYIYIYIYHTIDMYRPIYCY